MKIHSVLFILLMIAVSCRKELQDTNPYANCPYGKTFETLTDATPMLDGLIPCALGYTWIYADSSWQDGVLISTKFDTVRVTGAKKSGTDVWWEFSDYYTYCQGHDTIYHLNHPGMFVPGHVVCPEKSPLYYPVLPNTIVYWRELVADVVIGGTAFIFKDQIHTGIGNFSGSIAFTTETFNGSVTKYIQQGIGIIKTSIYSGSSYELMEQTLVSAYYPKHK
ncbi:MAG: hypothetical protein HXX13_15325 [Bacteroidetes bacterium]|nr:hypothetical protein [Bacteroidota bacterium]